MAFWKCPACGFEARDDKQKQEHVGRTASDPKHAKSSPGMGGMGGMGGQSPGSKAPTMPSNPWQKGPQKP
jgi:hypothetical protein